MIVPTQPGWDECYRTNPEDLIVAAGEPTQHVSDERNMTDTYDVIIGNNRRSNRGCVR